MGLIQWLRERFGKQKRSVQYEVQLMTPQGGWKRHQPFHWDGKYGEPDSDDGYLLTLPGRYREIRRVDGRIDEVIWTHETPDAETHYQIERERERLSELPAEDILEELEQRDELANLDRSELIEEAETLRIMKVRSARISLASFSYATNTIDKWRYLYIPSDLFKLFTIVSADKSWAEVDKLTNSKTGGEGNSYTEFI